MASTDKFPSGLNNWKVEDKPKREDFISDNQILDHHIAKAALKPDTHTQNNVAVFDANGNMGDGGISVYGIQPASYLYDGVELPFTWEELHNKIQALDFTGIHVGDYKTITLSTDEVVVCEVAGIDTYYNYGATKVGHHIDFISRNCLKTAYRYNSTATNSGGFVGSELFVTLNDTIFNTLPIELQQFIVEKVGYVETKTTADASNWSSKSVGKLWLPSECEVWGRRIRSEPIYGEGFPVQYPIFVGSTRNISKKSENNSTYVSWWLLTSIAGSATSFGFVHSIAIHSSATATSSNRIPICFRLG